MNLSEDEFNRISSHLGGELELAKDDLTHAQQQQQQEQEEKITDPNDPLAKYNLDDYDNEPVAASVSLFSNVKGLSYYAEDEQDPYITLQDGESDGDEELEELHVDPLDNLILTAKTEDDISHIEVYVYEEEHDNLYVHHDILLPSFPLCLEWLDFPMGNRASQSKGNFVAVGTFDPQVEIWDLDTVDSMFPEVILGRIPEAGAGLKKTKSKAGPARVAKRINPERHVDAVMSISWNTIQRNLIATGSADTTVKLWDMTRPEAAITQFTHHTNKVQAVAWNSIQPTVLLSGGYDQKVAAFDSRDPSSVIEWNLTADVECIKWDPVNTERFFVFLINKGFI